MKYFILLIFLASFTQIEAQTNGASYKMSSNTVDEMDIVIKYERLKLNGRDVWGTEIPYNMVWKPGITKPPVLTIDRAAEIGQTKLTAGSYSIFTIPGNRYWTVMITPESEVYDQEKVLTTLQVPVKSTPGKVEQMQFSINNYGYVIFAWDNIHWSFEIDPL
ncbi:DUF2911 domain-containing protein [Mangrovivirga cuniculi]|uniref:DUF2911 domain-containing protein n=1 Tax=Mangrovivirga cuniculi TaxID=2715131 RepID=A0A4D7JTX2_9BACT|nr:DUF2911 domain-containing protein [Mangrovivirga cuniculi]QCK16072.1 hypothetical protein DCC35_15650 [Mangrovivirga cuniculi]